VPFREAHEITGKLVLHCIKNKKELQSLKLDHLKSFSSLIARDIFSVLEPSESVKARTSYGGTSPSEVKRQIREYKKILR
jgi:argininosuccinate lyase